MEESKIPAAALESILCTEELLNRPSRPPNHEVESSALLALASALADSPRIIPFGTGLMMPAQMLWFACSSVRSSSWSIS